MPTVPQYESLQVAEAPMPQVRLGLADTPDAGRAAQEAGQAIQRAGDVASRIALDMQQEANAVRINDALNKAAQVRMHLTYDPEEGYASLKGEAALKRPNGRSLQQEWGEKFSKQISDIDRELGNEPQRLAFRQQAAGLRVQFDAGVTQHANREYAEHQINVAQNTSDTGEQQATLGYGDPVLVEQGLGAVRAGVLKEGQLRGWSEEQTQVAIVGRISKVHANIVQSAIQADQLDYAAQYIQRYEAEMAPGARLQADKLLQASKEKVAFLAADQLVRDSRDDRESLQKLRTQLREKEFADLSPEGHAQLEQRILAREQYLSNQDDIRARRQEAAAARRDRQADSAARSLQMMLDSGVIPDDATMASVSSRVAGTPFAQAVNGMLETASTSAAFAQKTPREQRAILLEIRSRLNSTGSNPAQEKRMNNLERIADHSERQLAEDPLAWGVSRRVIDAQPMNFGNIDQLTAHISERTPSAAAIAARTGVPTSPLFKIEADRAADMLRPLSPSARAAAVRQFARNVDPQQMMALGRQIGGKDSALGLAMFSATGLPANTPELILRGEDARTTKRVRDDETSRLHHQRIAREIDAVPWPTVQARDAATEAARLVYDGLRDTNGGSASVSDAIRAVTNGLGEWNGSKVPLPQGWDERRFRRALGTMDALKLTAQAGGPQVSVRGQAMTTEQLARGLGSVTLIPAGSGRYALESGGALVMTGKGVPLRIQLEN